MQTDILQTGFGSITVNNDSYRRKKNGVYQLKRNINDAEILDINGDIGVRVNGNRLDNVIEVSNGEGYSFDDQIFGRGGDDSLFGGTGSDRLVGGQGNDFLDASADPLSRIRGLTDGLDTLVGGQGADTFSLGDRDSYLGDDFVVIKDFRRQQGDKIQVQDLELYRLESSNLVAGARLDTAIYQGDDLIAVVANTIAVELAVDFLTTA